MHYRTTTTMCTLMNIGVSGGWLVFLIFVVLLFCFFVYRYWPTKNHDIKNVIHSFQKAVLPPPPSEEECLRIEKLRDLRHKASWKDKNGESSGEGGEDAGEGDEDGEKDEGDSVGKKKGKGGKGEGWGEGLWLTFSSPMPQ